jgi:hypothetical protein
MYLILKNKCLNSNILQKLFTRLSLSTNCINAFSSHHLLLGKGNFSNIDLLTFNEKSSLTFILSISEIYFSKISVSQIISTSLLSSITFISSFMINFEISSTIKILQLLSINGSKSNQNSLL